MRKVYKYTFILVALSTFGSFPDAGAFLFEPGHLDSDYYVPSVDQFVIIFDASRSMGDYYHEFRKVLVAHSLFTSMIMTIPRADYSGGLLIFGSERCLGGGSIVEAHPVGIYDADAFNAAISKVRCAGGRTPLADATRAALDLLPNQKSATSIIIISDGQDLGSAETKLARQLRKEFGESMNIYTIQIGENPHGRKVLQEMAGATAAGFYLNAVELTPAAMMEEYVIEVLLYEDDDGDGVANSWDECPDTPREAVVDVTGCSADAEGGGQGL